MLSPRHDLAVAETPTTFFIVLWALEPLVDMCSSFPFEVHICHYEV